MILDTHALSDFLRMVPSIGTLLSEAEVVCLPVIVVGEYRFGLASSHFDVVAGLQRLSR